MVEFLSDDYVYVDFAFGVQAQGKAAIREYMRNLETSASSDYRFQADRIFTDGESFAIEWTFAGTNDRPDERAGMPATGRHFEVPGATIGRLRDGTVVEARTYWNMAAYLAQLGLTQPPQVPVTS